jgi:hypothetical protein
LEHLEVEVPFFGGAMSALVDRLDEHAATYCHSTQTVQLNVPGARLAREIHEQQYWGHERLLYLKHRGDTIGFRIILDRAPTQGNTVGTILGQLPPRFVADVESIFGSHFPELEQLVFRVD